MNVLKTFKIFGGTFVFTWQKHDVYGQNEVVEKCYCDIKLNFEVKNAVNCTLLFLSSYLDFWTQL